MSAYVGSSKNLKDLKGELLAFDEMMLTSKGASSYKFTCQQKPPGIGLNAVLNFSDYNKHIG